MSDHHDGKKRNLFVDTYDRHYKLLMIFSFVLLAFSLVTIGYKYATTGDFVDKGVTLKGGIVLTLNHVTADSDAIQKYLEQKYPREDITVRTFGSGATQGLIIETTGLDQETLMSDLRTQIPDMGDHSTEIVGPSLGASFFTQTLKAIFVAFIFMSLVVFLYFGDTLKHKWLAAGLSIIAAIMMFNAKSALFLIIPVLILGFLIYLYFKSSIPSFAIIFCAFSDIMFALAMFNLLGFKLNTAGVAAFLMLLGYSIDTDILLSVRVLHRREGSVFDRTYGALKTGLLMSFCTLAAVVTALIFTHSSVIREIMIIIAFGMVADIIFTWIQNAGILRWHLEKKGWK